MGLIEDMGYEVGELTVHQQLQKNRYDSGSLFLNETKNGKEQLVTIPGEDRTLGKYSKLRQKYLLRHKPSLVQLLVIKGQWWEHLWEVDKAAQQQVDQMVTAMARQDGTDEALKERDPLRWVDLMNNYLHSAEEIVLHGLIYT